MYNIKVLAREDVEKLLKLEDVIPAVEGVYVQKAKDQAIAWPVVFYEFEPGQADMDIKSGWLKADEIFGLKMVSFFGKNADKGRPSLVGFIVLSDANSGEPIGILDGSYITGIRTGAAGALGAKYLANPNPKNFLLLGAGNIAFFQVAACLSLFPEISKVRICDPLSLEKAKSFIDSIEEKCSGIGFSLPADLVFESVDIADLAGAVSDSQIIITVTPSKQPIIKKEWVSPGTHFSCIGADMSGKEEIDPRIFEDSVIFVDDKPHCMKDGESEIPLKKGIISEGDIRGEIGELITGQIKGRSNPEEITIFDACGMAMLDLVTGKIALERAERHDMGIQAEL